MINKDEIVRAAYFSRDKKHRYALFRAWNPKLPCIQWIGLNPSMADHKDDDNTIRRVMAFSDDFGFGSIIMTNVFSFITPKPKEIVFHPASHKANMECVRLASESCEKTVLCWGSFKETATHADKIIKFLQPKPLYCLGKNSDGSPKHPLYLNSKLSLILFS